MLAIQALRASLKRNSKTSGNLEERTQTPVTPLDVFDGSGQDLYSPNDTVRLMLGPC